MFSKSLLSFGALMSAGIAAAKPIPALSEVLAKRDHHSFNGYGGYGSMSHFDDFYGSSDFVGVSQKLVQEKEVVCHQVDVEIVQQHLAVIKEWYKKIITEQVCEVEVQTIVHQQFVSGCDSFSEDLRRKTDRHVSYDHEIASHIVNIHDSSNECVTSDLGFHGHDIGSHAISYSGDNWDPTYSPPSVSTIWGHVQQSYGYSSPSYVSSWTPTYAPPSYSYGSSYTYEAPPPTYTSISTYGYGYVPPPSYGYGNSYVPPPPTYSAPPSYGGYAPPSGWVPYGSVSESVPSNSTDSASVPAATDSSVPSATDAATDSSAPAATDSAAPAATDSAAPVATDSAAASTAAPATDAAAASSAPVPSSSAAA